MDPLWFWLVSTNHKYRSQPPLKKPRPDDATDATIFPIVLNSPTLLYFNGLFFSTPYGSICSTKDWSLPFFQEHHQFYLQPWSLTWNLKITQLKRKIIFQTFICGQSPSSTSHPSLVPASHQSHSFHPGTTGCIATSLLGSKWKWSDDRFGRGYLGTSSLELGVGVWVAAVERIYIVNWPLICSYKYGINIPTCRLNLWKNVGRCSIGIGYP